MTGIPFWTDEVIAKLRALWDAGHSVSEIGRRLGCSKNSVVGKNHRLRLAGRKSPIRGNTDFWTPDVTSLLKRLYDAGKTDTQIGAHLGRTAAAVHSKRMRAGMTMRDDTVAPIPTLEPFVERAPILFARVAIVAPRVVVPVVEAVPFKPRSARSCCWLDGQRGSYIECGAVAEIGKPYCPKHSNLAFIKRRSDVGNSADAGD